MKEKQSQNGNRASSRHVATWVPKSIHQQLKAVARKERRSIASLLEDAVRKIAKEGKAL